MVLPQAADHGSSRGGRDALRLFVGDDWAEEHHDVEVMDSAGRRLVKARLPEGVAGIARLHAIIGEHRRDADDDDGQVAVGIETDRGPWVQALVAAGYTVYAVNPLQASRYRERHAVSGAKSDAGDAHVLADMVRTDSHQFRTVAGDTAQAAAVKVVTRDPQDADLGTHPARSPAAARAARLFPAALEAFEDLDAPDALELLAPAPDPASAARLTTRPDQRRAQARPPPPHRREGQPDPGRAAGPAPGPARRRDRRLRRVAPRPDRRPGRPERADHHPARPGRGPFWPAPGC